MSDYDELPEPQMPKPPAPPQEEEKPRELTEKDDFRLSRRKKRQALVIWIVGTVGAVMALLAILDSIKVTDWGTYQNQQHRVQIKYPLHWGRKDSPAPGALVVFVVPKETVMDDFQPNVSITWVPLQGKTTDFNQFARTATRQLTMLFENQVRVLDSQYLTLAGKPSYRLIHIGNIKDAEDQIEYMNVLFQIGGRGYIITYAAKQSQFRKHRRLVDKMINTFKAF